MYNHAYKYVSFVGSCSQYELNHSCSQGYPALLLPSWSGFLEYPLPAAWHPQLPPPPSHPLRIPLISASPFAFYLAELSSGTQRAQYPAGH